MNWLQSLLSLFRRPAPPAVTPPPRRDLAAMEMDAEDAIDDARHEAGLEMITLTYSAAQKVAAARVAALARLDRLVESHQIPGVPTLAEDMRALGFDWQVECLAAGQPTGAAVVAAWLSHPPHRVLVLDPKVTDGCVAVAFSASGVPYWSFLAGRLKP